MGRDVLIGVMGGGSRAADLISFNRSDVDVKISAFSDMRDPNWRFSK